MDLLFSKFETTDKFKTVVDKLVNNTDPINFLTKSTRGEKSRQYDLLKFFNLEENFTCMVNQVKQKTFECLKNNFTDNKIKNLKVINCWVVYGEKGSYHIVHRHNNPNVQHIATVTYLKIPVLKKDREGNFFYIFNDEVYEFSPVESQIVIMPIWLLHGTYPQPEGLRQTLNIDFAVEFE